MMRRSMWSVGAMGMLVAVVSSAAAQDDHLQTPWGDPNLQGIWDFRTITPLQRPEDLGDRAFLTAEEAASLESDVLDRNRLLLTRPAERVSSGGNVDTRAAGTPG